MELDGTVVGKFGVPGKEQGQFGTVHGLDCSVANEILTSEITQWRMQKFILHPTARAREQVNDILSSRSHRLRRPRSLFGGSLLAQQPREIAFESAGDFLKLPADIHFGEVAGVATTSTGNLWVYYPQRRPERHRWRIAHLHQRRRAAASNSIKSGKFLREIGSGPRRAPLLRSCSRRACGSMPRTTSGSWTAPRGWSSSSTRPAVSS